MLVPYVKDHILSLERCPDGMQGDCSYQNAIPRDMPAGTPTKRIVHVTDKDKFTDYMVGDSLTTQLALVSMGRRITGFGTMSCRSMTLDQKLLSVTI